ncbi:MAG: hypothetical protein LAT64_11890 [Phycisphaerales bacterium]|nr:hypothetical protein [Planctomycetota bacterium]MCH8509453.1 hypothetical protein [Phycisphaerales bacterium]
MRTPIIALCLAAGAATAAQPTRLVVYVFDQSPNNILRMEDRNNSGTADGPGEVTVFYDDSPPPVLGISNAQGLVALDRHTLLATDNFAPENIILLQDLDRNGDAFGPGEASVWFDGMLPIGITMNNPAELRRRADGSFLLLDNNTLDTTRPEAVYLLNDANNDGVIGPDEIVTYFELSPAGVSATTTFDVIEDNAGFLYTIDIAPPNQNYTIARLDPATGVRTTWLTSAQLFSLTGTYVLGSSFELEYDPDRDELIFGARRLNFSQSILAARDISGSGSIDSPAEIRVLWDKQTHADGFNTGSPRDFFRTSDGRLLWTDALRDRIMLMQDLNGDGTFQGPGETTVFYDAATAAANGQPALLQPLSITAVEICIADLAEPYGVLNFFDLAAYLDLYAAGDPAADWAPPFGELNFFDLAAYLDAFNAGCP